MGDTFLTGVIAPLTAQANHKLPSKMIARNIFVFHYLFYVFPVGIQDVQFSDISVKCYILVFAMALP